MSFGAMEEDSVHLTVFALGGGAHRLSVQLSLTLDELKVQLEGAIGAAWQSQILIYKSIFLCNGKGKLRELIPDAVEGGTLELTLLNKSPEDVSWLAGIQRPSDAEGLAPCGTKATVLEALFQTCCHSRALKHASPDLQADREVVLLAVQQNGRALAHAAPTMQADREVVLAALRENGLALATVSEAFGDDKEVVLTAVQTDGPALQYASSRLKDDKDVVMAAVRRGAMAMQHASEALCADPDVVLAATSKSPYTIGYAAEKFRNDKELMLGIVQRDGFGLQCLGRYFPTL